MVVDANIYRLEYMYVFTRNNAFECQYVRMSVYNVHPHCTKVSGIAVYRCMCALCVCVSDCR